MPRYFFQISGGYMSPADMIADKKSTFLQRTSLRIRSHMLIAERVWFRIGLYVDNLYM